MEREVHIIVCETINHDDTGGYGSFHTYQEYRTMTMYNELLSFPEVIIAQEMGIQISVEEGWDDLYEYSYKVKGLFTPPEYEQYERNIFLAKLGGDSTSL